VGRLREPAHNSKRADIVIFTKCPNNLTPINFNILKKNMHIFPYQKVFFTTFEYGNITPVFNKNLKSKPVEMLSNTNILAISGIANPKPFYKKLIETGAAITTLQFSDHHEFTTSDIKKIIAKFKQIKSDNKILLCTEKDAVRFKTNNLANELTKLPFYYLPVKVSFLNNQKGEFSDTINEYLSKYKLTTN
jgi:tetraacyldisaccharide 4'-kinase